MYSLSESMQVTKSEVFSWNVYYGAYSDTSYTTICYTASGIIKNYTSQRCLPAVVMRCSRKVSAVNTVVRRLCTTRGRVNKLRLHIIIDITLSDANPLF